MVVVLSQEFSAAIAAITAALLGPTANASAHSSSSGGSSANSSLSGSGVRPSASGRKPVLPEGGFASASALHSLLTTKTGRRSSSSQGIVLYKTAELSDARMQRQQEQLCKSNTIYMRQHASICARCLNSITSANSWPTTKLYMLDCAAAACVRHVRHVEP